MPTEATPLTPEPQHVNSAEPVRVITTDQAAPVNYDWGAIKWICDKKTTPDSPQSFGYAYLLPNTINPEHRHMTCQEIIYMLSGELKLFAHGEWTTLRPGQTALIPQGVRHIVKNEGWEPAIYIASFSSAFRDTVFKGQTRKLVTDDEKLY